MESLINERAVSLYNRIFKVDSCVRDLNLYLLSEYFATGSAIPGTLLHYVSQSGASPVSLALGSHPRSRQFNPPDDHDGIVDSLRFLLFHENYIKPYGEEHLLVSLLTKAF